MEYFFTIRNIHTGEITQIFSASYGMALMTLGVSPMDYDLVAKELCSYSDCPVSCEPADEDAGDWEPDWGDLDMGFDPYCGCYTDDC